MGTNAEKIVEDDETQLTAEEAAAKAEKDKAEAEAEAANKADDEAETKRLKEEAEAEKRAKLEAEGKSPEEIEAALNPDDSGELEIVREGTQPQKKFTQQQVDDIVHKRVKRLNSKVDDATNNSSQTNAELELAHEKNKLLALALEQAKSSKTEEIKQPNPGDFDDGMLDPEYIKQHQAYTDAMIAKQVADQVAKVTETVANTNSQQQQSEALLSNQVKHYERAEKIGAKDYEATEDVALKVLGNEVANEIINNFEDSHVILYYLGKNPDEASRISDLLKSKPIKGVAEVGRLSAELKVKSKSKTTVTPDPDEDINGDGNSQDSAIDRRLEKLREQAVKTGDMKKLMAFKRAHKL